MSDFKCEYCKCHQYNILPLQHKLLGLGRKFVKCEGCNLIQLFPNWTEEELENLYRNYNSKDSFVGQKKKKVVRYKKILERIKDRKFDFVMEIGSGTDATIKYLKQNGVNFCHGIDKDSSICDGDNVKFEDIKDYAGGLRFHLIFSSFLFEHIHNPKEFIDDVFECLLPGGSFCFVVPNIEDPLISLYNIKEFKEFYWYPYHCFYYDPRTIKYFFDCDVKVELLQNYGIINHLRWLLFKKPGNFNYNIPIIDDIYKFILRKVFKKTDAMIVSGVKK